MCACGAVFSRCPDRIRLLRGCGGVELELQIAHRAARRGCADRSLAGAGVESVAIWFGFTTGCLLSTMATAEVCAHPARRAEP